MSDTTVIAVTNVMWLLICSGQAAFFRHQVKRWREAVTEYKQIVDKQNELLQVAEDQLYRHGVFDNNRLEKDEA